MRLTYLGTATLALELGGTRLLTDPAFDPAGTRYDFGQWYTPRSWFASEKRYATRWTRRRSARSLAGSELAARVRFLELGESLSL